MNPFSPITSVDSLSWGADTETRYFTATRCYKNKNIGKSNKYESYFRRTLVIIIMYIYNTLTVAYLQEGDER